MQTPKHPLVAEMVSKLNPALRDEFQERAAIMEFEGAMLRDHAECMALLDVIQRHPYALTELTVIHIKINGSSLWWLTTNHDQARQHLSNLGGVELGGIDLADVVTKQFSGLAMLATVI